MMGVILLHMRMLLIFASHRLYMSRGHNGLRKLIGIGAFDDFLGEVL